jgi:hypothetical protein
VAPEEIHGTSTRKMLSKEKPILDKSESYYFIDESRKG